MSLIRDCVQLQSKGCLGTFHSPLCWTHSISLALDNLHLGNVASINYLDFDSSYLSSAWKLKKEGPLTSPPNIPIGLKPMRSCWSFPIWKSNSAHVSELQLCWCSQEATLILCSDDLAFLVDLCWLSPLVSGTGNIWKSWNLPGNVYLEADAFSLTCFALQT